MVEHIGGRACCFHFGQNQFDSGAILSSVPFQPCRVHHHHHHHRHYCNSDHDDDSEIVDYGVKQGLSDRTWGSTELIFPPINNTLLDLGSSLPHKQYLVAMIGLLVRYTYNYTCSRICNKRQQYAATSFNSEQFSRWNCLVPFLSTLKIIVNCAKLNNNDLKAEQFLLHSGLVPNSLKPTRGAKIKSIIANK